MESAWILPDGLTLRDKAALTTFLQQVDPRAPHMCQLCGTLKPAGLIAPMRLVVDDGPSYMAAAFVHETCYQAAGRPALDLAGAAGDAFRGGGDAEAFFGERVGACPRGVLVFEGDQIAKLVTSTGETIDGAVSVYASLGFTSARDDILDLQPPTAAGWLLRTDNGRVDLSHAELPGAFFTQQNSGMAAWVNLVRKEGRCLVVTGTQLGVQPGAPLDLEWARRQGLLVSAVVAVS